jgi:septal ring factor EnvC (AmiA/AmiB activator)
MFTIKNKIFERFYNPPNTSPPPSINLDDITTADKTLNDLLRILYNMENVDTEGITEGDLNDVTSELEEQIKALNDLLNSIDTTLKLSLNATNNSNSVEGSMDEKTIQLLQDKEIQRLTERLNKLKTSYNTYLNNQRTDEQHKIPIYSSCIVSEASGAYTIDNLNNRNTSLTTTEKDRNREVSSSVSNNNPFKDANITDSEINFDDILNQLNQLTQSDVNVNVGL